MNYIGFGKGSLKGILKTNLPFDDDIEVRAVAMRPENGAPVALLMADMQSQIPRRCLVIRDAVARCLKTPPENIGVFCTQNHGVPLDSQDIYDLDRMQDLFSQVAADALRAACPALMAYVEVNPHPAGVVNRRVRFDNAGSFTFYYGFDLFPDGRAGCASLMKQAIQGLLFGSERILRYPMPEAKLGPADIGQGPVLPTTMLFDEAEDPLIQGLFLKTIDGRPIGSICRWTAHPVTANRVSQGQAVSHSADYPYYVRQYLSRNFGGGAIFMTGPCGNQAPLVGQKSLALAEKTGNRIGQLVMEALSSATWRDLDRVCAVSEWVNLPVRSDYPRTLDQACAALAIAQREFYAIQSKRDPDQFQKLKALADEIDRLKYTTQKKHVVWCGLSVEDLASQWVPHPLFALRVGEAVIVGLPGEPFGAFSVNLRRRQTKARVLVIEECNGYLSYIPTSAEYSMGGYESNAAIVGPAAEAILLDRAESLIDRCFSQ